MEYAGGGDLLRYIKQKGRLKEEEAKILFRQVLFIRFVKILDCLWIGTHSFKECSSS
jgi:hypothetical protein